MKCKVSFGLLHLQSGNREFSLSHDEILEVVVTALCGELAESAEVEEAIREGLKLRRDLSDPNR